MSIIRIKVLRDMPHSRNGKVGAAGHHKGDIVKIKADREGTPMSRFWRDRLKDAAIDGCCEVMKSTSKPVGDK